MNRLRKRGNWTAIPNEIIRDSSLSTNARCLWGILQSFSEDFVFRTEYVRDLLGVGRDSYRSAFQELEAKRLAVRVRRRKEDGSWLWDIELLPSPEFQAMGDHPSPDLPATVQPATVQPATVNQAIYKDQEKEDQEKEDQEEEEHASAATPGQWLADLMGAVNIRLNPVQCDAIYMQVRAYMDEETAFRYLSIKSAELVAAGVKPRTMVRALVQDASEYAEILGSRAVGKNSFESESELESEPVAIELDEDGETLASMLETAGLPTRQAREIVLFAVADGTLRGRGRAIKSYLAACGEDDRIINTFNYGFEFIYGDAV